MRLLTAIAELVRSWWRVDRVRVSPCEGRLLRIFPGAIVTVRGSMWEVIRRSSDEAHGNGLVRYECRGTHGDSEMWIPIAANAAIKWIHQGQQTELTPEEISVWSPNRTRMG